MASNTSMKIPRAQRPSRLWFVLWLFIPTLGFAGAPTGQACHEDGCNCAIQVGLKGEVKPFSAIHSESENSCLQFCRDASLDWQKQNLSLTCLWQGKSIFRNEISLLDINFADCKIGVEVKRSNLKSCRQECEVRHRKGVDSEPAHSASVPCLWDGEPFPHTAKEGH